MTGLGDRLRRFFGGAPQKKPAKRAPAKTYVRNASDRAALIAEAMNVYRRQRVHAGGVLERTLLDFHAKPPAALHDRENLERLLALRRAQLDLGRLFAHDLKRFLVLVGIRQWLGEGRAVARAAKPKP